VTVPILIGPDGQRIKIPPRVKRTIVICVGVASFIVAPMVGTADAKPRHRHTLAWQVRHLSSELRTAMDLIDAQDDRISELEHVQRCTSWLQIDPASFLLPAADAGAAPVWTTLLTQSDAADGTYALPISSNACLDGDS
jgi:hypothetical protein